MWLDAKSQQDLFTGDRHWSLNMDLIPIPEDQFKEPL